MVLIFQRTLAHYRLPIFELINKITGAILCFGKNGPQKTFLSKVVPDFEYYRVRDFYLIPSRETLVYLDVFSPLLKYKPTIVITEFALGILSNWFLLFLRPFFRYKLILWSIGYNTKNGFHPKEVFRDRVRIWWMNRADAVILYSQGDKKLISPYLKNPEKLFVAQNTLDTITLLKIRNRLDIIGKEKIKKEFMFTEKYNLIYIGRLLKEKEPDRLINIFRVVSKRLNSSELHIVGDGPLRKQLERMAAGLKIKFWGSIVDDEKTGKLLFASDLMVMPGRLGLAIVHSFCFDCPVVSQKQGVNGPFHGPEIEYLIHGKTGYLVDYGNNQKIAEVIVDYLRDAKKQGEIRKEIRYMVKNVCSIDNMMQGFRKAVDYVRRGQNSVEQDRNKQ